MRSRTALVPSVCPFSRADCAASRGRRRPRRRPRDLAVPPPDKCAVQVWVTWQEDLRVRAAGGWVPGRGLGTQRRFREGRTGPLGGASGLPVSGRRSAEATAHHQRPRKGQGRAGTAKAQRDRGSADDVSQGRRARAEQTQGPGTGRRGSSRSSRRRRAKGRGWTVGDASSRSGGLACPRAVTVRCVLRASRAAVTARLVPCARSHLPGPAHRPW